MRKNSDQHMRLAAVEVNTIQATEADSIVYIPNLMATTPLPVRPNVSNEYIRTNGRIQLSMIAPSEIGLPYGTYPRMILTWIATESKIKKSPVIFVGNSCKSFLKSLGKKSSGGSSGSITAMQSQAMRLFSTCISRIEVSSGSWSIDHQRITKTATLLWQPNVPGKWTSHLILDPDFYVELQRESMPVDRRVLFALSHYPLAFDCYCWLTYRFFSLKKPSFVSWAQLEKQFGNTYKNPASFKSKFKKAIQTVRLFYPAANVFARDDGLLLYPSPPHIPPSNRKVRSNTS